MAIWLFTNCSSTGQIIVAQAFQVRVRADLDEFNFLVDTKVPAHATMEEGADGRRVANEPSDMLEPLPSVLQLFEDDTAEGLVLAYYTALLYMPALAPAQIDRLLRTRRDLSRADHHEILGQCITLYKNSTGDDNFAPGPVDVTGGAPAVPVAQKVRRAISAADKARCGLLGRFKTYSLSSRGTANFVPNIEGNASINFRQP